MVVFWRMVGEGGFTDRGERMCLEGRAEGKEGGKEGGKVGCLEKECHEDDGDGGGDDGREVNGRESQEKEKKKTKRGYEQEGPYVISLSGQTDRLFFPIAKG